jgi:hypothetical protein
MAKWKEPTTEVTTTGVDPRARMKEIRAEVKAFLKGDTLGLVHLGDLPDNMEDARRVIIATQDLLEIGREKHRKATTHICELVHLNNEVAAYNGDMMVTIMNLGREIEQLRQLNARHEQEIVATRRETQTMRQQRDAVLTTMRLERNMEAPAPAPAFIALEATPESNRGPVSLEQLFQNIAMGRAR